MLSKEEIEKAKERIQPLSIGDFVTWFTTDGIVEMEMATETLLQYIDQLENQIQAKEMEHEYDVNMIDEVKGEAVKLHKNIRQLEQYLERISKQLDNIAIDQIPIGIAELQQENRNLKIELNKGVDKEKRYCFYEDGKTGKCLGYSNINDDEPCEYCKTCEALSIKGDD